MDINTHNIIRIGIKDQFTQDYGSQESLMELFGLKPSQIAQTVIEFFEKL